MVEEYRKIKGYKQYQVSNLGNVINSKGLLIGSVSRGLKTVAVELSTLVCSWIY
jgi:hypothetical protein